MAEQPIDITGLTLDEVAGRLRPVAGHIPSLRRAYRDAMLDRATPTAAAGAALNPNSDESDRPREPEARRLVATIAPVVRHDSDGALTKFIQRTGDRLETESVIIPMRRGDRFWHSLCVSSQVGCRMGCTFCETAQLGLLCNLRASEIVGQVLAAQRVFGATIKKIVFMGMGEPFDNFDAVIQSVRVLTDPCGLSMSKRQVTISTVGRIEGIQRLASLGWQYLQLAVSLNAPNDDIRSRIMPINRADSMPALRETLVNFPLRRNMYLMIEYVLIPGVNDAPEHAVELAAYLRPVKCCVNVIPYNPRRESPWPAPTEAGVTGFMESLKGAGQYCKRRITKGRDMMAACGQLGNRSLSGRPRGIVNLDVIPA